MTRSPAILTPTGRPVTRLPSLSPPLQCRPRKFLTSSLARIFFYMLLTFVFFTATPAKAIEPTTVIAINAAVNALGSLLAPRAPDVTPLYLQQILRSQERLSQQLAEISKQLATLSTILGGLPRRVVSLDREISGHAVFESAMHMRLSFLNTLYTEADQFDAADRTRYLHLLDRLERAASNHLALIQIAGYSFELIVSLRTLQVALDALIDAARITGITTHGVKRYLLSSLSHITRAVREIQEGGDTATYLSFQTDKKHTQTSIVHAATKLTGFKEDRHYRITSKKEFYLHSSPPSLPKGAAVYFEYTSYYSCIDVESGRERQFSHDPSGDGRFIFGCTYYSEGNRAQYDATLEKIALTTLDNDVEHFWLRLTPLRQSPFVEEYIDEFNKAKAQYLLYSTATTFLQETVKRSESLTAAVQGLSND